MPEIEVFSTEHITPALNLWKAVEHIGLSSADEHNQVIAFLARNPHCSHVALDDGQLVGACLCGHDGRRGYIHHLAVGRAHRRGHTGARLLNACLAALRHEGIQKAHAFVFLDNPYADKFWAPQGWERRGDLVVYSAQTTPNTTNERPR